MSRPLVEMADIVRCAGQSFIEHSRKWINWQHRKVLLATTRCRTAALGGHRDRCTGCGHTTAISYNSCLMGSNSLWRVRYREQAIYWDSEQKLAVSTPH
jgi:hypothetical protein